MKNSSLHPLLFAAILFSVFLSGLFVGRLLPLGTQTLSPAETLLMIPQVQIDDTAVPDSNAFSSGKLNINLATEEDLALLPGIGKTLAARIVEYRQVNGMFSSIEDIINVKGIGEDSFSKFSQYITVGG